MKVSRIRINNIEFCSYNDNENDKYLGEFSCYQENPYYQHEDDFVQCVLDPDYYYSPNGSSHCRIHKSCFVNPESRYVIAMLTNDNEPDVLSVGDRPWTLSDDDEKDFKQIINMIYQSK